MWIGAFVMLALLSSASSIRHCGMRFVRLRPTTAASTSRLGYSSNPAITLAMRCSSGYSDAVITPATPANELVDACVSTGIASFLNKRGVALDGGSRSTITLGKSGFGDYQSNAAFLLTKMLKEKPAKIAEKIVDSIRDDKIGVGVLGSMDVSGAGFINVHLSEEYIKKKLVEMCRDHSSRLGIPLVRVAQRIVVDFSSPNIAKEMHVGHLRSTIIGDSISRVLEFLGHDVLRMNHVGDWGTQFGMLIAFMQERDCHIGAGICEDGSVQESIGDLVELYKAAKVKFDSDEHFQERARREVVKLQRGDEVSLRVWSAICARSRNAFQEIYDQLGVRLIERGESFYNGMLPELVQKMQLAGIVVDSNGAKCIFPNGFCNSDGFPVPLIVQKSDGGYLYATTDLAAIQHRVYTERADRIIYVTDSGQAQHFAMVFAAAEVAGLVAKECAQDDSVGVQHVKLQHVPFGLVTGEDGKKIKSRAGDSVKLKDLLSEAVRLAEEGELKRWRQNNPPTDSQSAEIKHLRCNMSSEYTSDGARNDSKDSDNDVDSSSHSCSAELSDETVNELRRRARIIGIGAVKYADLSMHRESAYKFSFAKMLSLSGNTAPYMMYAYVRIRGIQRKAAEKGLLPVEHNASELTPNAFSLQTTSERALAVHLIRFHEVLLSVAEDALPSKLCEYIFELSQRFNFFYENCPVLQAGTPALSTSRAQLCALTAETLKLSLRLLGLNTVEKM